MTRRLKLYRVNYSVPKKKDEEDEDGGKKKGQLDIPILERLPPVEDFFQGHNVQLFKKDSCLEPDAVWSSCKIYIERVSI